MNVKPNIGIINALIRITCGLTLLAWCTSKMIKRPWRDRYLIMSMVGAMKVGEGIVRYCPITDLCKNPPSMLRENNENEENQNLLEPINPT